jgi:hypothetical protein
LLVRREHFLRWCGRDAWLAGVVLALALGCGRSARETSEEGGPLAGEGGTDGGAAGTPASGGSATGGAAGTPASGGSATGGAAGTPASGGSVTGGAAGTPASGGSATGGAAGAGGRPDVPGHDDLVVRSRVMSAYDGLRVIATYDHNVGENSRSDARAGVISNGTFELVWVEGFDRDTFGAYVVLFVDRGDDTLCTPDIDPAWVRFASYDSPLNEPVILEFDPDSDDPSDNPLTCDEFNTWFDEDYRPPSQ